MGSDTKEIPLGTSYIDLPWGYVYHKHCSLKWRFENVDIDLAEKELKVWLGPIAVEMAVLGNLTKVLLLTSSKRLCNGLRVPLEVECISSGKPVVTDVPCIGPLQVLRSRPQFGKLSL